LMTAYAAGLRVSEVIRLRITDIESDPSRMLIRINHGKGNKDRYSLLSERLLVELHAYWKMERPRPWLFPCSKANPPMPSGTAQKVYNQARARAGIESGQNSGFHTLRHAFATHLFDAGVDPHTLQPAVGLSLHQNHLKVCPCQSPASDARQKPTRFALFRVGQSPSALGVRPCSRQSPARRTWTRGLLRPIALLKSLTSCAALPQAMPRPTPCLPLSSAYSMT
jgi:hypothetical protein